MTLAVLRVGDLPVAALDAAAAFHGEWLNRARAQTAQGDLAILFPPAAQDHHAWRLATVQDLAREAAPARVNAIVGTDEAAITETLAYLAAAPGITGQMLAVGGNVAKMD